VAVGRFHIDALGRAEMALLVEDAYQQVGLGRLLLNRLVAEAADRGLRALDGHVLYDNQPMLQLLRSSGAPIKVRWDGGDVVSVELEVGRATSMPQRRRSLIDS
jgi:GNAT superfamily N-acetyltransferase